MSQPQRSGSTLVDTHVHVFEPARFPYVQNRSYTPGVANTADLKAHLARIGADRVVLVQPSVYGADNRAILDTIQALGQDIARGVGVIDDDTTDAELAALYQAGIRGLRLNVHSNPGAGHPDFGQQFTALAERAAKHQLFVQIFADAATIAGARDAIAASPTPVLLDHFGGIQAAADGSLTGLPVVTDLLSLSNVWVKLSAMYRVGEGAKAALPAVVRALVDQQPDRLVWASDWPHTGGGADRRTRDPREVEPFRNIDSVADLALLRSWIGDDAAERAILGSNADRLYGFGAN